MVTIVDETGDLDLDKLSAGINKSLAVYARPLFLRIVKKHLSITGKLFVFQAYVYFIVIFLYIFRHIQAEKS